MLVHRNHRFYGEEILNLDHLGQFSNCAGLSRLVKFYLLQKESVSRKKKHDPFYPSYIFAKSSLIQYTILEVSIDTLNASQTLINIFLL